MKLPPSPLHFHPPISTLNGVEQDSHKWVELGMKNPRKKNFLYSSGQGPVRIFRCFHVKSSCSALTLPDSKPQAPRVTPLPTNPSTFSELL